MLLLLGSAFAGTLPSPSVSVWIDAGGAYHVASGAPAAGGPTVADADLPGAIAAAGKGGRVRVHADPKATVGALVRVQSAAAEAGIPQTDLVVTEPSEGVALMPVGSMWPVRTPPDLPPSPPLAVSWRPEGVRAGRRVEETVGVRATTPAARTEAALQGLYRDYGQNGWDPAARDLLVDTRAEEPIGAVAPVLATAERLGYYWPVLAVSPSVPEVEGVHAPWRDEAPAPVPAPDLSKAAPPPDYSPEPMRGLLGSSGGLGSRGGLGDDGPTGLVGSGGNVGDPDLIILGALDRSAVLAGVAPAKRTLDACLAKVHGKLTVKFVVDKRGKVSSAEVKSSTLGDPAAEGCVTGAFKKLSFPPPTGGGIAIVAYGIAAP